MSMSSLGQLLVEDDLQEQICYVQCGYCATVLLVSVPCRSLTEVATVRCGQCSSLLSVNLTKASFLPLHLLSSSKQAHDHHQELQAKTEVCWEQDNALDHHHLDIAMDDQKGSEQHINNNIPPSPPLVSFSSSSDDDQAEQETQVINKPPERRQRAPSAYNLFIGQEIHRLKAMNPTMTHKQAFSMAAKNWAHFPQRKGEAPGQKDAALN